MPPRSASPQPSLFDVPWSRRPEYHRQLREWTRWARAHPQEAAAWRVAVEAERLAKSAVRQKERIRNDRRRWRAGRTERERHDEELRQQRRDYARDYWLRTKYGVTLEEFNRRAEAQGGACAACGEVPATVLVVDHDHECCPSKTSCGRCVRDLICKDCNVALGYINDDPSRAMRLIDYLARHGR